MAYLEPSLTIELIWLAEPKMWRIQWRAPLESSKGVTSRTRNVDARTPLERTMMMRLVQALERELIAAEVFDYGE